MRILTFVLSLFGMTQIALAESICTSSTSESFLLCESKGEERFTVEVCKDSQGELFVEVFPQQAQPVDHVFSENRSIYVGDYSLQVSMKAKYRFNVIKGRYYQGTPISHDKYWEMDCRNHGIKQIFVEAAVVEEAELDRMEFRANECSNSFYQPKR